jgi:predicted  nucleic acid-binding Zn-ribbon protein
MNSQSLKATCALLTTCAAVSAHSQDLTQPLINWGGTTATALAAANNARVLRNTPGSDFQRLASSVAATLEEGRAASLAVQAPMTLVSSALGTTAALDPEPVSKTISALAAYGAYKFGEAIGNYIYKQSEQKALGVLSLGLSKVQLSPAQLQAMPAEKFAKVVEDLVVGGKQMKVILSDQPKALDLLKAHAEDLRTNIGVAALLQAKKANENIEEVKQTLRDTSQQIDRFQKETANKLEGIKTDLTALAQQSTETNKMLGDLAQAVNGNSKAIAAVTQISSLSWTTEQKLVALRSGLFTDLDTDQRAKAEAALVSKLKTETLVATLAASAQNFGYAADIAAKLGVDPKIVQAAQAGQMVATGIANFATGNYLGAISSVAGLAGLGAPDAAASRHAALMSYLDVQFKEINQQLKEIRKTLNEVVRGLYAVDQRLQGLEAAVEDVKALLFTNTAALQALLKEPWQPCDALLGALNNVADLVAASDFLLIFGSQDQRSYLTQCYRQHAEFFDATVRTGEWGGGILSYELFPITEVVGQQSKDTYLAQRARNLEAYAKTREFVIAYSTQAAAPSLTETLINIVDVAPSISRASDKRARIAASANVLKSAACSKSGVMTPSTSLSQPLSTLLCRGAKDGELPLKSNWSKVLNASLLGPQVYTLTNLGFALAPLSGFTHYVGAGDELTVVPVGDFIDLGKHGKITESLKRAASSQHQGKTLARMDLLVQSYLIQQSVLYGDYTVTAVLDTLYDTKNNRLKSDTTELASDLERAAYEVFLKNDVVARNVVIGALRRALTTAASTVPGTPADTEVLRAHALAGALAQFATRKSCSEPAVFSAELKRLLPSWPLDIRGSAQQVAVGGELEGCRKADDGKNTGPGVLVAGRFYAIPSSAALDEGLLEQPLTLKAAQHLNSKLAYARLDLSLARVIEKSAGKLKPEFVSELLKSGCLVGDCLPVN